MSRRSDAIELVDEYGMDAVVAALGPIMLDERRERLERTLLGRLSGVSVVLENLTDPHNGGAALRSCEAFGLLTVYIVGQPLRFSERVTQGCEKWLDIEEHERIAPLAERLKREGRKLYAAVPDAKIPLESLDPATPAVFLVGNEHDGLTDEARALCDLEYSLPMQGFSESVNLSVATALTIYTHAGRRREHLGREGDLDEAALAKLRARYYARSVEGAAAIVRRHLTGRTS